MALNIEYPANEAEWYAKGYFENGTYFEIPAVFNSDGSCDVEATDQKVSQFEQFVIARNQITAGS